MNHCCSEENLQAYLDRELSPDVCDEVAAHLAVCTVCAALADEAEQTMMMIGSAWANELPDVIPTARLRARVHAALAEQAAPRFAWLWNWKLAAVAAAILLAISLFFLQQPKPSLPQEAHTVAPVPVSTPDKQITSPPIDRVVAQQQPRKRPLRRTPARKAEDREVVTPFFPLREGEDIAALESVRLVRVELPGSALCEVGLPIDQENAPASVKADVLLGDDGLARAIRFVR